MNATPPRRSLDSDQGSPFIGDDGSIMLAAYEGWQADAYWLSFGFHGEHGCQRVIDLGIRPAIARFGRTMTIRGIAKRLRCSACGGQNIGAQVSADCRGASVMEAEGPAPETRADFSRS